MIGPQRSFSLLIHAVKSSGVPPAVCMARLIGGKQCAHMAAQQSRNREYAPDLCRHGRKSHVLLTPDHFAGGLQVAFVTVQLPA
jgi:hypothetical protein